MSDPTGFASAAASYFPAAGAIGHVVILLVKSMVQIDQLLPCHAPVHRGKRYTGNHVCGI